MSVLYFAYGSNLLPSRLVARCPGAVCVGSARAKGFALDFSKIGSDGSGKATLVASRGETTPGALYEISDDEIASLDRHEGVGFGYRRIDRLKVVRTKSEEEVHALSYIADRVDPGLRPYDWYLALVIAGARHHRLNPGHRQRLAVTDYVVDPISDRNDRLTAIAAFEAHGIADYAGCLRAPD